MWKGKAVRWLRGGPDSGSGQDGVSTNRRLVSMNRGERGMKTLTGVLYHVHCVGSHPESLQAEVER